MTTKTSMATMKADASPRQRQAAALYTATPKVPIATICVAMGISRQRVYQLLEAAGVSPVRERDKVRKHANDLKEVRRAKAEIQRRLNDGERVYQIATDFGLNKNEFHHMMRKMGVRTCFRITTKQKLRIEALHTGEDRLSTYAIGRMMGLNPRTVQRHLQIRGKLRTHAEAMKSFASGRQRHGQ